LEDLPFYESTPEGSIQAASRFLAGKGPFRAGLSGLDNRPSGFTMENPRKSAAVIVQPGRLSRLKIILHGE
jgi:hypothetical protein